MTLEEYFEKYPIEVRELTIEDVKRVVVFCKDSLNYKSYSKDDNFLTKRQKIDSYKSYCKVTAYEYFKNKLTSDGIVELHTILDEITTISILNQLED